MKTTLCAVLFGAASVEGFVQQSSVARPALQLEAHKEKRNDPFGPAFTAAVVGWSLASQVAFAGMTSPNVDTSPLNKAPSIEIAKVETMDFSMPSYDSFGGDDSKSKQGSNAPAFNPFGDFQPGYVDESKKEVDEKAAQEAKAAAEAKQAEDRAAAKARQAEEKAEKEAAAAAKKAEKEARLKAEKEKQEGAAARAKAAAESDAAAAPSAPAPSPQFDVPEFKAPDLSGLKFSAPKIDMPKMDMPKMDMPKFDAPSSSTVDMPKINVPKVDIPEVNLPKISLPSFGGGGGDKAQSKGSSLLEPQPIRDEKARQAKQAFAQADQDAKDVEQKAREARELANAKKQAAKEARDLACADRPGGKILCLRNPFSTGF